MSRKIFTKKRFPQRELLHHSFFASLFVNQIMRHGKKFLAKKIFSKALSILRSKTEKNPMLCVEKAVRNASPRIILKVQKSNGFFGAVPSLLNKFSSTKIAIRTLVESARKHKGISSDAKLAMELFDAARATGVSVKRRDEIHKIAEANRAFA